MYKIYKNKYEKKEFLFVILILIFLIFYVIENLSESDNKIHSYNYSSLKQLNIIMNTYYKIEEIDYSIWGRNKKGFIQAKILIALKKNYNYSNKNNDDYIKITFLDSNGFKLFSTSLKFSKMNKIIVKDQIIGFIYNDRIFDDDILCDNKFFNYDIYKSIKHINISFFSSDIM